ncbi:hypothetical protein ACFS7Z_19555 [Pontibacter toksunensis]|uniref:DUF4181 domain-containing protein n=1 Tax=Pontibacter toksunensis TaxID=1332631 RepID=A0ABW6BZV4_9BACT
MDKDLIIYLCGLHSLGFAIFHMFFWRLFEWDTDLEKVSKQNKAIIQIFNLRLIYIFLFFTFICFFFTKDLYSTGLGKVTLVGCSLFWVGRAIEQFIFLNFNHSLIHLLTFLFVIGAILFILPLL